MGRWCARGAWIMYGWVNGQTVLFRHRSRRTCLTCRYFPVSQRCEAWKYLLWFRSTTIWAYEWLAMTFIDTLQDFKFWFAIFTLIFVEWHDLSFLSYAVNSHKPRLYNHPRGQNTRYMKYIWIIQKRNLLTQKTQRLADSLRTFDGYRKS